MSAVFVPDSSPDAGAIWHCGDPFGEQRAALTDAVVVDRSHRGALTLTGKDRNSWLHTISTQHVADLADGATVANLSLDGQGRVEDHWIQTDMAGTTYLDTEPWRTEPLLAYLRRMMFWADVTVTAADFGVLSLLGPGLSERAVLDALGAETIPAQTAIPLWQPSLGTPHSCPLGGGFLRLMPADRGGPAISLEAIVPRDRLAGVRDALIAAGVRPAGIWAYEAHRVAGLRPRLGMDTDERTIPHEVGWIGGPGVGAVHLDKGCYRGQETVARVHNLGRPPRMLVLAHLDGSTDRPPTGAPVLAGGRTVGRVGSVVDHVDLGPIALALVKRGLPVTTELTTDAAPGAPVPLAIDPDTVPADDAIGAGRAAVERLRGQSR